MENYLAQWTWTSSPVGIENWDPLNFSNKFL